MLFLGLKSGLLRRPLKLTKSPSYISCQLRRVKSNISSIFVAFLENLNFNNGNQSKCQHFFYSEQIFALMWGTRPCMLKSLNYLGFVFYNVAKSFNDSYIQHTYTYHFTKCNYQSLW